MVITEKVQRQRESLLEKLALIAQTASDIDAQLSPERHPKGTFYRSLKPRSGMYIVHTTGDSEGNLTARFCDERGREYNIRDC